VLSPEVLAAGPVAEIREGEMRYGIVPCEQLLEFLRGVFHLDAPGSQSVLPIHKLRLAQPAVIGLVQLIKLHPEVVVHPEEDEQVSELGLGDVVITEFMWGGDHVLGGCVGADDDGLGVEEFWQLEDISDALVDFGQGEVAVGVHVELVVDDEACSPVLGGDADGDLVYLLHR
jgi:hypothetical protein